MSISLNKHEKVFTIFFPLRHPFGEHCQASDELTHTSDRNAGSVRGKISRVRALHFS